MIGADESGEGVSLRLDDGSTVTGDVLLVATGRVPNGDQLDLGSGGIEMTGDGRVAVDRFGRSTSAQGVWALGDVSSPYMLKHVANAEMRAVRHNLLHPDDLRPMPHGHVPSATFGPQAATLIQQMITVLAFDLDVREVATRQYWIHPALLEVTENALFGLEFT